MREAILSGKNVTKTFGENTVLRGIDIELYSGDFTVIMGASGFGKSTLLHTLSGMDYLSNGRLFYQNEDITNASEKKLTKLRAEAFGFVFQRTHLVSNLMLNENIRMAGLIGSLPEEEVKKRTEELIKRMNLEKARDRLPAQVSGGEAQRAAVARANINKPAILYQG